MIDVNSKLIETCLSLINTMADESKLELIAQLSLSMKNKSNNNHSIEHLFGSFDTEETAEEWITRIRNARVFNRKIVSFD